LFFDPFIGFPLFVAAINLFDQVRQQRVDRLIQGRMLGGRHRDARDDAYRGLCTGALVFLHFSSDN
jgi:hypothetical protein